MRCFATISNDLGSELSNAKPFESIPVPPLWTIIKGSLPGGRYHKKSPVEMATLFLDDFGDTIKFKAAMGNPTIVMTRDVDSFEKVNFFR